MAILQTFQFPSLAGAGEVGRALGQEFIAAGQADGTLGVRAALARQASTARALGAFRGFFRLPLVVKGRPISGPTCSGYVVSGEGETRVL